MKRLLLSFFVIFGFISAQAKDGFEVKYDKLSATSSQIHFTIGNFDLRQINLNGADFTKIGFAGKVYTKDNGFAELPFIHVSIQLEVAKNVSLQITGSEFTDYDLDYPLVPSRGVIYRNQDPSQIPYVINPQSIVNQFYPGDITKMTDPFIVKDVRGTTVYVYPFQYNAATQSLRVYSSVTVKLTQNDSPAVNQLMVTSPKVYREMEGLYKSVFVNYQNPAATDLTMAEAGDILVITTSRDEATMQPYIDWKKAKGYKVYKEVVATGTNVKTLIQTKYNANNDILYVQLVGDWADIKCDLGGGASAPMDPMLGCVVGTDYFPDIAIGRFSAASPADVTVQVNKVINYEKNPMMGETWYSKAIGVASNQGAGIGDDGEIDYDHINLIYNSKLDPYTYDGFSTAYDPGGTAAQVKSYIETGASIINYCGHGSKTSWGSTGFSNTNVNTLVNGDKLPFIFSVACVNGEFHTSGDCFAEAWLKKSGGGAVMTLMATINQSWAPPMRGEDYFNDMVVGGYDYNANPGNGITTTEGRTIIGSIVVNGFVLMYTESNASDDLATIQTWTIFGDPSMQVRTITPATLSLSSNIMLVGTPFTTTVSANGTPIEGAMVCLSQNDVYAMAYTDASGNVTVENNFLPGDVQIVVTGHNTETIFETIQCIPATGAYVVFDNVAVNDANGMLDYGETSNLNLGIKNVGVTNATNVLVTISSTDEFITILDATENFGTLLPTEVKTITDAFAVEVAANVPDGHGIMFTLVAVGEQTWESTFSLVAHAGALQFGSFQISDPNGNNNGFLDPGETATMVVNILNNGSANVSNVMGLLSSADPYVSVLTTQPQSYGNLAPGQSSAASYSVFAAANTPFGYTAQLTINLTGDLGVTQQDVIEISFADYCDATTATEDEYISKVVCGTISNTSGWQGAVANYTNLNTTLEPGVAMPITITNGNPWAADLVTVWVDWNLNKEFTGSNETYTLTNVGGSGSSFTGNITAPANQPGGQYRMRIRMTYSTAPTPCGDASYGEIEDYVVNIAAGITANFTANVTSLCENNQVQFTDNSTGGATSWAWTFQGGTPSTSTEQNPLVTYITHGSYDVTLEVSNGATSHSITKSAYINVMTVPDQAGPISGDNVVGIGETENYAVPALDECSIYDWTLTPIDAGTMVVSMNSVEITWSQSFTGYATLKVCGGNDCGMGLYSDGFEVMVSDYTGINNLNSSSVEIYPNPNNGQFSLTLNSAGTSTYEIKFVNALGMIIFDKMVEVNGAYNENLNIANISEGIYFLSVKNDKTFIIRKVVVQK